MLEDQLERLAGRGIGLLPTFEIETHFVFTRDGFIALVERRADGFGRVGAVGLLVQQGGFAALVWRGGQPWFVAKGFEQPATDEQVAQLRNFSHDLEQALK